MEPQILPSQIPSSHVTILFEFARFAIMSLAFVVALYAFIAKESRLREGAEKLLLVIFVIGVSALIATASLLATLNQWNSIAIWLMNIAMVLFSCGWGILLFNFWNLYGILYHMRQKRFLKYVPPFVWFYSLLSKRYALSNHPRQSFTLRPYELTENEKIKLMRGCTIFLLGDKDVNLTRIAIDILVHGLQNNETGDYVCCHRPPDNIWEDIITYYPNMLTSERKPNFIDAYSPNFGFDDEILKERLANLKDTNGGYGIHVFPARTVAGIHTAGNTSWYINKKRTTGTGPRRPHRTIYDRLSALVPFSSIEQINNFIHHFMAAEKAYGMLTIIVETTSSPSDIINTAYDLADVVIEFKAEQGKTYCYMKKGIHLNIVEYSQKNEYIFIN